MNIRLFFLNFENINLNKFGTFFEQNYLIIIFKFYLFLLKK